MSRGVIILYWLIGQGFVFQLICKVKAVPTTSSTTSPILSTESGPASENQSTTTTVAIDKGGKSVEFIDAIVNSSSLGNSSSLIAFDNETETSSPGVILLERRGKAMDFGAKLLATPEDPTDEPVDNSTIPVITNATSTSLPEIEIKNDKDTPSNLTAKLATKEDQVIEPLGDVVDADAPPKSNIEVEVSSTQRPKLKAIQVNREDLVEPRFLYVESTKAPLNERDRMIQDIFGGECTHEIWNKCNRITYWGGDYVVPDKRNPGQTIVKHHKIKCIESPSSTVCLKNGWSVARCHMLCMSQCNIEYRLNFEDLVLHDGACRFPLLLKK